jgi:hypothetical protein
MRQGTFVISHLDSPESTRGHPLAFASASVYGDHLDRNEWTRYFGIEPDVSLVKGELFKTPSGRMSKFPARTGLWSCTSKSAIADDNLDPHLKYLILLLGLPRADLPAQLVNHSAKMRFFCYWSNYSGDRVPVIDPALRDVIESSGATIEIDEYPQRQASSGC